MLGCLMTGTSLQFKINFEPNGMICALEEGRMLELIIFRSRY
jgi:hypothetical protein